MMDYDIWFSRHNGQLYVVGARHGKAPTSDPIPVSNVKAAYAAYGKTDVNIVQAGIMPPDALGLFDTCSTTSKGS
jgi:hypothetical protein